MTSPTFILLKLPEIHGKPCRRQTAERTEPQRSLEDPALARTAGEKGEGEQEKKGENE